MGVWVVVCLFVCQGVVLVDDAFKVVALTDRVLVVSNRTRELRLMTSSYRSSCEWMDALNGHFEHHQRRMHHDFDSFSPVRHYSPAAWYVDGAAAFAAMAQAMEDAQDQIFISGWWLSPDVQLIRRRAWQLQPDGTHCGVDVCVRLIDIIWRKQTQGVKVHTRTTSVLAVVLWFLVAGSALVVCVHVSDLHSPVQGGGHRHDAQRICSRQGSIPGAWGPKEHLRHPPPQPPVSELRRTVRVCQPRAGMCGH